MSTRRQNDQPNKKRKLSKRDRRMRFFVYLMVIAMVLSLLTAGLSGLAIL